MGLDLPILVERARLWLGDALDATGDRAGACAAWRAVTRRWPEGPWRTAVQARERLASCEA